MENKTILKTPLTEEKIKLLKSGDYILLSGEIYTARDMAHKRLCELIKKNQPLPFDIVGAVIYYAGPSPAKPGEIIGSIGPTTSYRMDTYTSDLLKYGLKGTIGKGPRSKETVEALKKYKSIYFCVPGGIAALLAESVVSSNIVAFEDLGPEAIYKLQVKDFPLFVCNDTLGNDLYTTI